MVYSVKGIFNKEGCGFKSNFTSDPVDGTRLELIVSYKIETQSITKHHSAQDLFSEEAVQLKYGKVCNCCEIKSLSTKLLFQAEIIFS